MAMSQLKFSKGFFDTYTALLHPLHRFKPVPSSFAFVHSQQAEPAIASNGRSTRISLDEDIARD